MIADVRTCQCGIKALGDFVGGLACPLQYPNPSTPAPQCSATDQTMLGCLLTISALTGLAFSAVGDEYRQACKAVEAAISNASEVYYPGECGFEQLL